MGLEHVLSPPLPCDESQGYYSRVTRDSSGTRFVSNYILTPMPSARLVTHPSGGKYVLPAHTENRAKRDLSVDVGDEAWAKMAHWSLGRAMNAQRGVIQE
jgi:hypothetical protein